MASSLQSPAREIGRRIHPGFALAVLVGGVLAWLTWLTGTTNAAVGAEDIHGLATEGLLAATVAIGVGYLAGVSMVVLPCGFPAVFAVPELARKAAGGLARARGLAAFVLGAVVPLAVAGVVLAAAGGGAWDSLPGGEGRVQLAAGAGTLVGLVVLLYAAAQAGMVRAPALLAGVQEPKALQTGPTGTRMAFLGLTLGAGMGIACPMPAYYALLGWVTLSGSPVVGGLVLGAYGAGRATPPVVIAVLALGGLSRRRLARPLVRARGPVLRASSAFTAAAGAFLIVYFGVFVGTEAFLQA